MPRGLRFAAVVCLILSCISGLWAAMEASHLANLDEAKAAFKQATPTPTKVPGATELNQRVMAAQLAALEPVRETRTPLLFALSVACAFCFVASGRMLRPGGLSRERMRRMLGITALGAAVLRTIEGAQWAAVTRNMVGPMSDALRAFAAQQPPEAAAAFESVLPSLSSLAFALNMAQTAVMAGTFALLSQYFRSERVRDAVLALDGPLDAE
jgi:hypothetical protein